MEQVIATEMYNGQYWIIIIERIDSDGRISIAKYTFGPEPTFNDLVYFYDNIYPYLRFHPTDELYRVKKKYKVKELNRMENKSFNIYNAAQKIYLESKKIEKRKLKEKYKQKQRKKKIKKRGK